MNNRVKYKIIGFLVFIGFCLMMAFSYWMLKPTEDENVKKYAIYFNESVLGLNLDAPVKYRGIAVGKVTKIAINPKNSEQVEVIISILKTTPIKVDTTAQLTAQGITGLTYINLSMGGHLSAVLKAKKGEKYPVIRTKASFLANVEKSFGSVSSHLSSTLGKTEKLLGSDNQAQITRLLKETANAMESINVLLNKKTIAHFQSSLEHLDSLSKQLDATMPRVNDFLQMSRVWEKNTSASFAGIAQSYVGIKNSMDGIHKATAQGVNQFQEMQRDLMPMMRNTLLDMQESMVQLQATLKQFNHNPSEILYTSQKRKKAPGEK